MLREAKNLILITVSVNMK